MDLRFNTYRQVYQLLKDYPFKLIGVVVFSFFGTLLEGFGLALILPMLEGTAIESDLINAVPFLSNFFTSVAGMTLDERVRFSALVLVVFLALRSLFAGGATVLSSYLQIQTEGKLQRKVFRQVQAVQLSYIHGEKQGNILEVLTRHVFLTGQLLQEVLSVISSLLAVFAYVLVMMWLSWQLTLLTVVMQIGISLLVRNRLAERIKNESEKWRVREMGLTSILVETLSAIKLIHLFAREKYSYKRFEEVQEPYVSTYLQSEVLLRMSVPLYNLLNGLVLGALLVASTYFLAGESEAWLGQVILFIIIIFRLMIPAARLNYSHTRVSQMEPAYENVRNFLRTDDKPYLKDGSQQFFQLKHGVRIENVTFCYEIDERSALKEVSLQIPAGKITAVVGASGAGKTTLVNLISRLYDPQEGKIRVDEVDLTELQIESWRRQIAVVSQDTFLFNDTVLTNLKFARPEASFEEVQRAASLAQAHEFITQLPHGYNTMLGDRGVRLSGGQQQRIAIARALLVDPQLLILDEATSDLDSETERAIQVAIDRFSAGRTSFIIAHRLSTVRQADNIIVLSNGRVMEQGNHKQLMSLRGYYWRLVQAQDLSVDLEVAAEEVENIKSV